MEKNETHNFEELGDVLLKRQDNRLFFMFLFCSYIVCFVAKSNKCTCQNNKPNYHIPNILEDFENASPYFCCFLANRICN